MANLSANLSGYGAVNAVTVTAEDGTFTDDVAVTDALTAATINGMVVTSGIDVSGTPASIAYRRLGDFYVGIGAGAPTWDVPVGSIYFNTSATLFYQKWGAAAGNWIALTQSGSANPSFAGAAITSSFLGMAAGVPIQFLEGTAPSGVANSARLFAQDNGSGKTQLMVIFGSGVAQQLAIEA